MFLSFKRIHLPLTSIEIQQCIHIFLQINLIYILLSNLYYLFIEYMAFIFCCISLNETSSLWVMIDHLCPKGSVTLPARSP